jgi:hypothetical protein
MPPFRDRDEDDAEDDDDDLYELSDVHDPATRSLPSMMPARLHRALNAYARRSANNSSIDDSDSDDGAADDYGKHAASDAGSLEALLRKKAREGQVLLSGDNDKEADLESQKPAWANSSTSSNPDGNALKVCRA